MTLSTDLNDLRYRSPTTRAKLVTAAFLAYGTGCAWTIWLLVTMLGHAAALQRGDEGSLEALASAAASIEGMEWQIYGLHAMGVIAFCFWTHRVASNVFSFGALGDSPGMAVGYYFIPLLNLWKPYQALATVWIESEPGTTADHWLKPMRLVRSVPLWIPAWWAFWIGSRFLVRIVEKSMDVTTMQGWMSAMRWTACALVVELIALALMLTVVWTLTRRQEKCGQAGLARAEVVG